MLAGWLYTTTHFTAAKLVRAERRRQSGALKVFKRWFFAMGAEDKGETEAPRLGIASQVMKSPIIVAAVDVDHAEPALLEQLRDLAAEALG